MNGSLADRDRQDRAGAQPARQVRCRQIADADLDALAEFLAHGFPDTTREYWTRGLARAATLPPVAGMPRYGYVMESQAGLVGAILVLSSLRPDGRIIANVSSWYVRHSYRTHSTLLAAVATKVKQATYLNISPAPHTWRALEAQNYVQYGFGRSAAFPVLGLGGGKIGDVIPPDLPEAALLTAHRALGCLSLVCEKDGMVSPFVFKSRRLNRPPVKMMEVIYCRDSADFARCGAVLGRWALRRGAPGFLLDGKIQGMASCYVSGKEPRWYRGDRPPALNDLAFTEKVIFA